MWFKHSMSIAQQLIHIYNTTVHKNKSYVALNVANWFSILCDLAQLNHRLYRRIVHNKIKYLGRGRGGVSRCEVVKYH